MAAKAKETGNIDFTMLYRLFLSIWFNADNGNLTFSEKSLCFQGFLCPLLFLLSQIWDKKGNHLRKHDFLQKNYTSLSEFLKGNVLHDF